MPYFIVLRARLRFDQFNYRECWLLGWCSRNKGDGSPNYIEGLGKTLVLCNLTLGRDFLFIWTASR